MSEIDYHDQILAALQDLNVSQAEVTAELRGVVSRLDKVNGSVDRHEDKLSMLQLELANRAATVKADLQGDLTVHIMNCPWRVRVEALEAFVIAYQARSKANDSWLIKMWPVIYAAAGVVFYMILLHASSMLKLYEKP